MAEKDKKKEKKHLLTRLRERIRARLLAGEGEGKTAGTQLKQMEELGLIDEREQARIDAERRKALMEKKKKKNGSKQGKG